MHEKGKVKIYTSKVIEYEISNIPDVEKRRQVEDLYDALELEVIPFSEELDTREEELEKYNINYMDAYHLAYAEKENIDYFITVDKQLINASKKADLKFKVINPVEFIMEVI